MASTIVIAIIVIGIVFIAFYSTEGSKPGVTSIQETGYQHGNLTIALGYWGPPSPFLFYPRGPGYVVTSFIFDTLLWKNNQSIIPWLADKWSHPDSTTWIFHLRQNIKWQDGKPLTADDVAFTFNYLKHKGWTWKNINPSLIKNVTVKDKYTVVVKLSRPYPFFLEDYATTIFILPKHIWANVSNPYTYKNSKAFIGSGPYILEKYDPQRGYLFKANPEFWGGTPLYNYVRVLNIGFTNPQEEASALLEGKTDTAIFIGKSFPLLKRVEERTSSITISKGPMYWVLFLGFNLNKWPYNQTLFRRSIAYSLNLTQIAEKTGGGLEASTPGSPGYIPPYSDFYNPDIPEYTYDPAKAKIMLEQLGLMDLNGDGCLDLPSGQTFSPILVTTKQYVQEALLVKSMLRKTGICVSVKTVQSYKQLDTIVKKGAFDMEINGHGATGNTPTAFSWYFTGRFGVKWVNKTYMEIVGKILSSPSKEQVYHYSMMAQRIIASQLPEIALYYPNIFVATNPSSGVKWFFTKDGIDGGIPLPYNKLSLIKIGEPYSG